MSDLILSVLVIVGTYIGSAVFALVLFRIFFPLRAKVIGENKLTFSYSENKSENSSNQNKVVHLLSLHGRRDWVKINS